MIEFQFTGIRCPMADAPVNLSLKEHGPTPADAPKVVHTPGVCGGRARLDGTRIAVWILESLWQQGMSVDDIVAMYPFLTPQQVECALDWADENVDEIEADISAHENG